jgi:GT2 family glycosyltransferase
MSHKIPGRTPPLVSIISAVDDHPTEIHPWLQALNRQTLPPHDYEVLLVDAVHQLDYESALADFQAETDLRPHISCRRIERGGRAHALNRALELSRGQFVIFLGYDFIVPPQFAEAHLAFHRQHPETEAVGVGAALFPAEFRSPFAVWLQESGKLFGAPFSAGMTTVPEEFFYAGNASVKRELLDRAGRFDECFPHHAFDDQEFGLRLRAAGMKAQFVPDATVTHAHELSLEWFEAATRRSGAAARIYRMRHPGNHGWPKAPRAPAWHRWWRVATSRLQLAVTGSDDDLIRWWQARLNAALGSGYRNGLRDAKNQDICNRETCGGSVIANRKS